MFRRRGWYQCQTCGGILGARERRAHLGDRHGPGVEALTTRQVAAAFTQDIDIMHPGRADKWGYRDDEIGGIIPGLEPIPGEARDPRYPDITVQLTGTDGNAFAVLGKVLKALRQAGVSEVERDAFKQEATAGTYDELLQTVMQWVQVD